MLQKKINLFLLIFYIPLTFCMEPTTEDNQRELKEISIQQKNKNKFEEYIRGNDCIDHATKINVIKSKLLIIQYHINVQYNAVFTAIQKKYEINDGTWKAVQSVFKQSQSINVFNHKKITPVKQNENIPFYLLAMFKKNLQRNNIPENMVQIKYTDVEGYTTPRINHIPIDNHLCIYAEKHASIKIIKLFTNISLSAQEGLCLRLSNKLATCIDLTKLFIIIRTFVNPISDKTEFDAIVKPIYNLSILQRAVENKSDAHALKNFYDAVTDDTLPLSDYKTLCKIDRLHRVLEWFEKYM